VDLFPNDLKFAVEDAVAGLLSQNPNITLPVHVGLDREDVELAHIVIVAFEAKASEEGLLPGNWDIAVRVKIVSEVDQEGVSIRDEHRKRVREVEMELVAREGADIEIEKELHQRIQEHSDEVLPQGSIYASITDKIEDRFWITELNFMLYHCIVKTA
jgi:hypothetical protein